MTLAHPFAGCLSQDAVPASPIPDAHSNPRLTQPQLQLQRQPRPFHMLPEAWMMSWYDLLVVGVSLWLLIIQPALSNLGGHLGSRAAKDSK